LAKYSFVTVEDSMYNLIPSGPLRIAEGPETSRAFPDAPLLGPIIVLVTPFIAVAFRMMCELNSDQYSSPRTELYASERGLLTVVRVLTKSLFPLVEAAPVPIHNCT
jgi:hypothetical protein